MAFATASSPANREPGDNAQTATPPQAQARPRQSPGKAEPPTRARAPACATAPSAHQAPSACQAPSTPEPASACQNPQRTPEPQRARAPARAGTKTWWVRCRPCSGEPSPQRTPGRKPGSGALIEPTIGLRDANRATRRVPRALAGPSSESPRRRIVNFVRPWSKQAILRSLKAKTRDYLRYREAHARTTDKNVHFSLPRPRKTVCFDRQRPKPTVFRIARPESGSTTPERGARAKAVVPRARSERRRGGGHNPGRCRYAVAGGAQCRSEAAIRRGGRDGLRSAQPRRTNSD